MKKPLQLHGRLVLNAAVANESVRKFSIEAYDGGPLPIDGFDLPVIADLSDMRFVESMPLLIDHKRTVSDTLGTVQVVANNGLTVTVGGIITGTSPLALQVLAQSDLGQKWQASISANIGELEKVPAGKRVGVNGQTFEGPVYVARHNEMFEVSVLPLGADMTTKVNLAAAAASAKGAAAMSFEQWLAALKIDPATLAEEDKAALMLAYDAKQNPPAAPPVAPQAAAAPAAAPATAPVAPIAAKAAEDEIATMQANIRAAAAKERSRITKIEEICAKHPQICATAIEKNWSLEQAEIAVLKAQAAERQKIVNPRIPQDETTPRVLEAALCQARNIPGHEKKFTDQELQAAHSAFRGRIGLQQIIIQAAAARGYGFAHGERISRSNIRAVLKYAFADEVGMIQAAAPTILSLPGIFSNVANKELLAGYEIDESYMLWKQISKTKSVSDYKTVTCYRLLDNFEYEELPPGGKMHHGSVGEDSYTRSVKTYAKMFKLTQVDIVNDDLGAFDDLRDRIGTGGAIALSNKFWAKFLDNSSFFTSGRGNYISGGTTNLGTDGVGLQLGLDAFRAMRSSTADGAKRIGGEPAILMVPIELTKNADLYYVNNNLASVKMSDANPYQGKYKPLVVPWLSDSTFSGYSATAWYLFRNPGLYAPMVVSFLDGVQTPTVESADADFDELGVQFRGYHDFGCDQAEYVAGIKSKGAA